MRWWRWQDREQDLERELRSHLESEAAEQQDRGLSTEEARYAAQRVLGNTTLLKEEVREMWGWTWIERISQDLRYAARVFARSPIFVAAIVVSLALGIGANTAIFSLLDAVSLRTLPVQNPEQLVIMDARYDDSAAIISYPVFRDLRERQTVLTGLLATSGVDRLTVQFEGDQQPRRLLGDLVSADYFSVLGVHMSLGRNFTSDDESPHATPVAVISSALWQRHFQARPSILGQTVLVSDKPTVIVGVTTPRFVGDTPGLVPDVWVLLSQFRPAEDLRNRDASFFALIGRLRSGIDIQHAQTGLSVLYQQLLAEEADQGGPSALVQRSHPGDYRIELQPGGRGLGFLRQEFSRPLMVAMVVVALVLIVACANVANLLLARAMARRHEVGVRLALGASRTRLLQQLVTETVVLALTGGALGLALTFASSRLLTGLLEGGPFPLVLDLTPNRRILLFTLGLSFISGIVFGLVPALQATRTDVLGGLGWSRTLGESRRRHRVAKLLVVLQIASSLFLAVIAALLGNSIRHLHDIDPGFAREGVLLFDVHQNQAFTPDSATAFSAQLHNRVATLPGIASASFSWLPVLGRFNLYAPLAIDGYTPRPGESVLAHYNCVSAGYFETIGIPLRTGRGFSDSDRSNSPLVVVVNESFAKQFFPGHSPIGRFIKIIAGPAVGQAPREIVGVVGDSKYNDLRGQIMPLFYAPLPQLVRSVASVEIRARGAANPVAVTSALPAILHELAPSLIVDDARTIAQQIERPIAQERLVGKVAASFGLLALLLATVGLFGLVSYGVARRSGEMALRMALGASSFSVVWLVLREGFVLIVAGIGLGLALAVSGTRLVSSFLYGVKATDPLTIAAAALLLAAVGTFAAYLPARRASKADPLVALRYE